MRRRKLVRNLEYPGNHLNRVKPLPPSKSWLLTLLLMLVMLLLIGQFWS